MCAAEAGNPLYPGLPTMVTMMGTETVIQTVTKQLECKLPEPTVDEPVPDASKAGEQLPRQQTFRNLQ